MHPRLHPAPIVTLSDAHADAPASLVALALVGSADAPQAPKEFRLFAAGEVKTVKGTFLFDSAAAELVMAAANEWGNDFPIDYNHAMVGLLQLDPAAAGAAAGWFKPQVRDGELWATDVTWTPKAKAMLEAREYRYCSPTFHPGEKGRVERLVNVALTNIPATHKAPPLMAHALGAATTPESPKMKTLLVALGLNDTATEAEALARFQQLQTGYQGLLTTLSAASLAEAQGRIVALQAEAAKAVQLQAQVAQAEQIRQAAELDALLDRGVKEFKIAPAQLSYFKGLGIEAVKGFLAVATAIVPGKGQAGAAGGTAGATEGTGNVATLTAADNQVAQQLGVNVADLAKHKAAVGAIKVGARTAEGEGSEDKK
jgi:phage I-like protein